MALTKKDKEEFEKIICKSTRSELNILLVRVEKEIRLSEIAISEGFEKKK